MWNAPTVASLHGPIIFARLAAIIMGAKSWKQKTFSVGFRVFQDIPTATT
jgi:hypothetical protein